MGIFTTVGRWFSPGKRRQARVNLAPAGSPQAGRNPNETPPNSPHAPPTQDRPVAIDLHTGDESDTDAELEGFDLPTPGQESRPEARPPKSRQELIAELQRNYQEVLGIVRKVDTHLDEQGRRGHRLAEIAERFPQAAEDLANIRQGHDEVHEALRSVSLALRERDTTLTENQRSMLERLEEIRGLMAEASESERQLVGSLVEFRDMMGSMAAATERLSDAVERIEARDDRRADELLDAVRSVRSSVVGIGIVAAAAALIALALGLIALAV
jgi:hypothetical protein